MEKLTLEFDFGFNSDFIQLPLRFWNVGYFPDYSWYFSVLTDDNVSLMCSRKRLNGKGIYSEKPYISIKGYFSNRLKIPQKNFITRKSLLTYGRTSIDFYKIDDENYYMDFSKTTNK